jgi:hypothetical protein
LVLMYLKKKSNNLHHIHHSQIYSLFKAHAT